MNNRHRPRSAEHLRQQRAEIDQRPLNTQSIDWFRHGLQCGLLTAPLGGRSQEHTVFLASRTQCSTRRSCRRHSPEDPVPQDSKQERPIG